MKLRPLVKRIGLAAICFLFGSGVVLWFPFPLSEPNTTVQVTYMRYACGECYVQQRIIKVGESNGSVGDGMLDGSGRSDINENLSPIRFLGWDVAVIFKGNSEAISQFLEEHADASGNCRAPTFRLKGRFKRKLIYSLWYSGDQYDGIYFDADEAVAIYPKVAECKQPAGEVPLQ